MPRRPAVRRARLLAAALLIVTVACAVEETADVPPDDEEPAAREQLSAHPDVATLAADIRAADLTCELEYEGLRDDDREVSTCVIDGEQATLSIWADPALVDELLEVADPTAGAIAYGANWTVETRSGDLAAQVADAAGGAVHDTDDSPRDGDQEGAQASVS